MSETLWVDADALLVDYLREELGSNSDYNTLVVNNERIFSTIIKSPNDWRDWQLPSVIVMGNKTFRNPGPHGDGEAHYDKQLPYLVVVLVDGDQVTAVRDAKILEQRVAEALRKAVVSLYAEDHESLNVVSVGDTQINLYRNPSPKNTAKSWWALVAIEIMLESTV